MASSDIRFLFLLSLALFSHSCLSLSKVSKPKPSQPLVLPIMKDPSTKLFYTSISLGTPLHKMSLTIDLGGPSLWYDCDNHYNSSSYRPITCNSKQCPSSSPCSSCDGVFKPGCTNNTCGHYISNPFVSFTVIGNLGQDVVFLSPTQALHLLSSCINSDEITQGLATSSKGVIGLARTQLALPTQFTLANKLSHKFALCLPSSNRKGFGHIFIGFGGPYSSSQVLHTTPLLINPVSTAPIFSEGDSSYEYFIGVKSIRIDAKVVNFKPSLLSIDKNGNGGTKISTMSNVTKLHSSIFGPLVREFVKRASDRKIKKVASVAPFDACFDVSSIGKSSTGLDVPTIELMLQGGAKWSIYGANSMVMVKRNVVCLGFVDGGKVPDKATGVTAIVIGGHVLEDNLLEFDLASSKLSFSSTFLLRNASCSHF